MALPPPCPKIKKQWFTIMDDLAQNNGAKREKVLTTLSNELEWRPDWPCAQLLADKIMEVLK